MLACMLSLPVTSVADKDSTNDRISEKIEAHTFDSATKSDADTNSKKTNAKDKLVQRIKNLMQKIRQIKKIHLIKKM